MGLEGGAEAAVHHHPVAEGLGTGHPVIKVAAVTGGTTEATLAGRGWLVDGGWWRRG
jgi:hypothetical protein